MLKLELEENCWSCDGSGTNYQDDPEKGICRTCRGTGRILTGEGDSVVRLVEKYFRIKMKPGGPDA